MDTIQKPNIVAKPGCRRRCSIRRIMGTTRVYNLHNTTTTKSRCTCNTFVFLFHYLFVCVCHIHCVAFHLHLFRIPNSLLSLFLPLSERLLLLCDVRTPSECVCVRSHNTQLLSTASRA